MSFIPLVAKLGFNAYNFPYPMFSYFINGIHGYLVTVEMVEIRLKISSDTDIYSGNVIVHDFIDSTLHGVTDFIWE